ncbi:hypothetical protein JOC54_000514 [Alkalihalobacillus xiaoxiensis]|uniref:Uncharacterized protein n=1 Tax=Shouchella xiaoxiensis TaxID=766895 RepID=A0ABS2SP40_9BACI|nr:hypothetical protein [Shouchella xiaoxiensis]MBM7837283.1 hypothetical protein [Shouchella xiaoxiensis]
MMASTLIQEAQHNLEGYVGKKTKVLNETNEMWVFACDEDKHYQIRKSDGATYVDNKLVCLLAFGEEEKGRTALLLRLLQKFPAGVQLLNEDNQSYYVIVQENAKRRKRSVELRISKQSGFMYKKEGQQWSVTPILAC